MPWMTAVRPRLPSASVYSDQPTIPSSVVTFRNEKVRQPASQCRSSIRAIFMVGFLRIYLGPRPGYRGLRAEQPEAGYIGAMNMLLSPLIRALSQFDDPIFLGVLARSVAWSIACFIALHFAAIWLLHRLLDLHGAIGWAVDLLGSVGASLLALWLFLPVAAAIGTLYFDRIAAAVERRYYPYLPPPEGAPLIEQAWDGIMLGLKILGLNVLGLILALMLPGIGLLLGWAIAAYAIGRGLFVAVAMRRMPYPASKAL